jgi:O-methyltransferase involved in polyketide biosynthesis
MQSSKCFAVTEQQLADSVATFIPTQFSSEPLDTALEKANFDKSKPSFFVWLGGARYSTIHAVVATLSFIASLPRGSAVVLDYIADCTSLGSLRPTALGALASRIAMAGSVKHLI